MGREFAERPGLFFNRQLSWLQLGALSSEESAELAARFRPEASV